MYVPGMTSATAASVRRKFSRPPRLTTRRNATIALGTAILVATATVVVLLLGAHGEAAAPASVAQTTAPNAVAPQATLDVQPVSIRNLVAKLTRTGVGPFSEGVDVVFGHPALLRALGEPQPADGSIIFTLTENIHEDTFMWPAPALRLEIDGTGNLPPVTRKETRSDIHHRATRYVFSPSGLDDVSLFVQEAHTLALVVDTQDGLVTSANRLVWRLPLDLPGTSPAPESGEATAGPAAATQGSVEGPSVNIATMSRALRRRVEAATYGGVSGIEIDATYAAPEYFAASFPPTVVTRFAPAERPVFVLSETTHTQNLPDQPPSVVLRVNGTDYEPDLVERKAGSPHHRVTLVRFPVEAAPSIADRAMELRMPGGESLGWRLPIAYDSSSTTPFGLSWATVLALLGGLLASMWPCLFQLTVYFIPALAGLNMQEASGRVSIARRADVLKAAFFFVLGFTIVYTSAGAALGFAAQQIGESSIYESAQRWIGVGAGVLVLFLALRVAAKVRAPLVCKMPLVAPRSSNKKRGANPLEMMLAGLAFATGCMTCFGSAVVIGMVVYVGLAQSAAYGAFILFLFSLGMGIPLVIAATLMARVMPLLFKMEKLVPWMGLASAALMIGFGVLLITNNYMALSEWVFRFAGAPAPFG